MTSRAHSATAGTGSGWIQTTRGWWPPLRRREFWLVQALVLAIAGGHALIEALDVMDLHGATFIPVSLYLLPVVYASLAFGMRGAAPTAVWSFILTTPNVLVLHHGMPALGDLWQATLVLSVGLFIGHRVDRERTARRQAEARERERRVSEERYRGLFEMAADAILLLDADGRILEANAAAGLLLGRTREGLVGLSIGSISNALLHAEGGTPDGDPVAIERPSGTIWIQPIMVPFSDETGDARCLVQLHDVTMARERQHLVESFARDTVAAREEERRRVARDLHDGPLQSLMQLWRDLDALGDAALGDEQAGLVAEARARAEETADELRRFSRDLRPSILDDLGLATAMKAEAHAFGQRTGLSATTRARGESGRRLPMEIELTLLRIFQESLRNIEHHADARRVTVDLHVAAQGYRLQISDDGVGIGDLPTPSALVTSGRLGVVGMQERARLVGATCVVRPGGKGTVVEVFGELPPAGE